MKNKNICGFSCALEGTYFCMEDCPNALQYNLWRLEDSKLNIQSLEE